MPRIPTVEGPRLREQALQGGFQRQIDTTAGTRALGQALGQVSENIDKFAKQQAETEAWNAQDEIYRNWRDWYTNETTVSQGEKAVGLRQRADAWWESAKRDYTKTLSPLAQQVVGKTLAAMQRTAYDNATAHETQQLDIANTAAFHAGMSSLAQSAISATPEVRAATVAKGVETIRARAAEKGIDASPDELKWTTGVHTNVIGAMVQTDPAKARQYFTDNRAQIDATQHDNITKLINTASTAVDGSTAADEIWKAGGPRSYAEPVSTDKLLAEVNKRFSNDPERRKAAEAGVKDRIAAHNQAQQEYTTAATNAVLQLQLSGMTVNQMMARPEWQALVNLSPKAADGIKEQEEIRRLRRIHQTQAVADIELKNLQRRELMFKFNAAGQFIDYSDPEKLRTMTRDQVTALRATLGNEYTAELTKQWDRIQNPDNLKAAQITHTETQYIIGKVIPEIANKKKRTGEEDMLIGQINKNVFDALNERQATLKRDLTPQERSDIINAEVNRTVTIYPSVLSRWTEGAVGSPVRVPAVSLTAEQIKRIVLTPAITRKAATYMNNLRNTAPTDAMRQQFEPTPENVRRFVAENYREFFPNGQQ